MTNLKSDLQIQNDVRDELMGDPEVNIADIGVIVVDGMVTLRGTVEMSGEKWAAARDTRRIAGVCVLNNDITITPFQSNLHPDADDARHVADALLFDWSVPNDRVEVEVSDILIVQPHVSASDIEAGIKQALVRTAEVDAGMISIALLEHTEAAELTSHAQ